MKRFLALLFALCLLPIFSFAEEESPQSHPRRRPPDLEQRPREGMAGQRMLRRKKRRQAKNAVDESGCIGRHETIELNGVSIHLEIAGEGKPVILLHGNGGNHTHFSVEIRQLVEAGYQVYAMDSRGQGMNAPLDEYHYTDMAEDVMALIAHYGLDHPAIHGWSDGGIIALELALAHPDTVGLMAISGANIFPDGIMDLEEDLDPTVPLDYMILTEPNHAPEELEALDIPVLVTAGSEDFIKPEHTQLIADHLPQAELVIVDGEDHESYIYESEIMGNLLIEFLERQGY